ncbi:MAG: hypothetical protein DRJ52_00165 [Thermoprotei archaeon]|nr:MAG: hypothetical protein DRJ52_00165 [Thermoprotei archaeon]RLF00974.1 MAG: hypothetical protein DRJ63_01025 [Thermoprotei archaeon]HDI74493.1 4Fe-4S binding protein [Thermoprotei archaeon]
MKARGKIMHLRVILAIISFILMNLRFFEPWIRAGVTGISLPVLNCFSMGVMIVVNKPSSTVVCAMGALQRMLARGQVPLLVIGSLLVIGAILGRAFCGWICPFGLIQEFLWRIAGKKNKIPIEVSFLQDAVLLVVLLTTVLYGLSTAGMIFLKLPTYGNIIDETFYEGPFCSFCPSATLLIILPSRILEAVYTGVVTLTPWAILRIAIVAIILFLSLITPRPFCRWICPLGVLMGYFNKVSVLTIKRNSEICVNCRLCEIECPMNIDITSYDKLTTKRCIKCMSCVNVCAKKALRLEVNK